MSNPTDAPPTYETATGHPSKPAPPPRNNETTSFLHPSRNGIPASHRRSMEDEQRALPEGWIRQFDAKQNHQYFVDTRSQPPRSIWHHPYDDEEFLATLTPEQREQAHGLHSEPHYKNPSQADIRAESSDEEDGGEQHTTGHAGPSSSSELPPRPQPQQQKSGLSKLGRRMKDRLTSSTHEEREAERAQRAREEEEYYRAHQRFRQAMVMAAQTGQPQFLGRNKEGREVYIEPPGGPRAPYGAHGFNPYAQGPYANPNAIVIRQPDYPYGRPYGYGYGGGMGVPLMGGLMGGMLLGGMLW